MTDKLIERLARLARDPKTRSREFRISTAGRRAPLSSFPRSQAAARPSNEFDRLGLVKEKSGAAGLQPCAEGIV
jgi:hypothetical protein